MIPRMIRLAAGNGIIGEKVLSEDKEALLGKDKSDVYDVTVDSVMEVVINDIICAYLLVKKNH